MLKTITKEEACRMLNIPNLSFDNLNLHWTDHLDTETVVNLCFNRKKILEIGTYLGHTTENIAKNNLDSEILTIDICKDICENLLYQNNEILSREESGRKIISKNVTKELIKSDEFFLKNKEKFDAIFIDGDHSFDQVKKDSENSLKALKEGGILIWHDVYNKDNKCNKSLCEPDHDDVRIYLESRNDECFKIGRSWIAFFIKK
jgi:predicted O-methyltransferase YrrM